MNLTIKKEVMHLEKEEQFSIFFFKINDELFLLCFRWKLNAFGHYFSIVLMVATLFG